MIKFFCKLNLVENKFNIEDLFNGATQNQLDGNYSEANICIQNNTLVCLLGDGYINGNLVTADSLHAIYEKKGVEILPELDGHFLAIVIDNEHQTINVLSDKFSTIPLYYYTNKEQIILSTSLKSIATAFDNKPAINPQAIYNYIYFHCIPSPHTVYEDIYKLEPAHKLTWENNQLDNSLYWLPTFSESEDTSSDVQQQALRTALNDTLTPLSNIDNVGAFLSGGLDSSSVAAFLAKNSENKAKTFTIGFSEPGYDETEFAAAVAEHLGTDHHVYQLTPKDVLDALPKIAEHYDEPFGNSSALPTYFCGKFAKENGVDTLLAGDGGDELFAGNERYATQKIFEKFASLPSIIKAPFNTLVPVAAKVCPISLFKKANSYIFQANQGLPTRLQHYNFLHQNPPSKVFTADILQKVDFSLPLDLMKSRYAEISNVSNTNNMLYLDWKFTLADNDLVKVNNMTDLAGVDVKYPMLSKELLALSCKVSSERKLPGNKLRDFYKQSLASVLPDSTINKSKQGFGLPFGMWLTKDEGLIELTDNALNSLKKRNLINPEFIDEARENHRSVHAHYYGELVWIMVMLELWLQSH